MKGTHLSLELLRGLSDERGVEDETVLGRVVLRLERAEEGLLGTEDLDRRRGVLGKVEEGPRVGDETGADELADECRQVRRDGRHAVLEVLVQLRAVLRDRDDLVREEQDVHQVRVRDFGSHRDGRSRLKRLLELFGEDCRKVGRAVVSAES